MSHWHCACTHAYIPVPVRVANLAFLKPDFQILAFFENFWLFFGNQKKPDKIWLFLAFFSRKDLALEKHF